MDGHHGWTSDDMNNLLDQVLAQKSERSKKFNSAHNAKNMDWETISVSGKSSEDCKNAFLTMTNYVYRSLTLENICQMAKTRIEEKNVPLEMVPDAPKKPVTAYFIFSQKKKKKLMKKNPGMSVIELNKVTAEMWSSLTAAEKAKYSDKYHEQKAEYDKAVGFFSKSMKKTHKEGRLTPYDLFSWADETSVTESKAAYNALTDKKTLKWIWKAIEELKKRLASDNGDAGNVPTLYLNNRESKILFTSEGIYEKPARTLQAYYRKKKGDPGKNSKEYESLNVEFKALEPLERKQLNKEYITEIEQFLGNVNTYLEKREETLPENEKLNWQFVLVTYQKLVKQMQVKIRNEKPDKSPTDSPKDSTRSKKGAVKRKWSSGDDE